MRTGSTRGWSASTSRPHEVPEVLGERAPAGHDLVHEVGVTGVVVLGVPVQALAEAAQVRGQHHVAAPGELGRVVTTRLVPRLDPADTGLARAVAVDGQDGRPRARTAVGHQEVGGYGHRVLGVVHQPVAAVPVRRLAAVELGPRRDPFRPGRERRVQTGGEPDPPVAEGVEIPVGQRIRLDGGGQSGHHLEPGGEVPVGRDQGDHARPSFRPGHAHRRRTTTLPHPTGRYPLEPAVVRGPHWSP